MSEVSDGFGLERAGTAAVLLQELLIPESYCVGSGFIHYSSKKFGLIIVRSVFVALVSYMWSCL